MAALFFSETRPLRNKWVRLPIILTAGARMVKFGRGFQQQIIRGLPWGRSPMSDGWLIVLTVFFFALAGL